MTGLKDEDDFAKLLQQAEPQIPEVNAQAVLDALQKTNTNISLKHGQPIKEKTVATHRQIFALAASLLAIALVVLVIPERSTETSTTLAEFQATKNEEDALANQFKRLTAIDNKIMSRVSTVDIRASESLWMLLQEYESNVPSQRQHAELIVSLYSTTPAAERCRKIFPDR